MKKDIEAMFICYHIVNSFNDAIISFGSERGRNDFLIEFVHAFIYEIQDMN
jgi:hypothetical protein